MIRDSTGAGIIYVAGHTGLAGSAIHRALKRHGYDNVVAEPHYRLDLTQPRAVDRFFDDVMVMTEEPRIRANRLALLRGVAATMNRVADIGRLAS